MGAGSSPESGNHGGIFQTKAELRQQTKLATPGNRLCAIRCPELIQHMTDVPFDGVERDHQLVSDHVIWLAGGRSWSTSSSRAVNGEGNPATTAPPARVRGRAASPWRSNACRR